MKMKPGSVSDTLKTIGATIIILSGVLCITPWSKPPRFLTYPMDGDAALRQDMEKYYEDKAMAGDVALRQDMDKYYKDKAEYNAFENTKMSCAGVVFLLGIVLCVIGYKCSPSTRSLGDTPPEAGRHTE